MIVLRASSRRCTNRNPRGRDAGVFELATVRYVRYEFSVGPSGRLRALTVQRFWAANNEKAIELVGLRAMREWWSVEQLVSTILTKSL